MTDRARVAQQGPPPSLARFPRRTVPRGTRVYRAARREPWCFCTCGRCRFDLPDPHGTLYVGTDELVGVLEAIGPELVGGTIETTFLATRRIFSRPLGAAVRTADLCSRRAAGYGVTNELSTMTPYDIPRAWATRLHAAGYGGIRYRGRFDTATQPRSLAVFGTAGTRTWRARDDGPADDEHVVAALRRECDVTVVGPPRLDQLDVLPPPDPDAP